MYNRIFADRVTELRLKRIEAWRTTPRVETREVFDPYTADWNTEVGPVSGHEYRSMKDTPLTTAVKWSAKGLLAVLGVGLVIVAFGMLQELREATTDWGLSRKADSGR